MEVPKSSPAGTVDSAVPSPLEVAAAGRGEEDEDSESSSLAGFFLAEELEVAVLLAAGAAAGVGAGSDSSDESSLAGLVGFVLAGLSCVVVSRVCVSPPPFFDLFFFPLNALPILIRDLVFRYLLDVTRRAKGAWGDCSCALAKQDVGRSCAVGQGAIDF